MSALTLTDLRRAWDTRDPELPGLIARIAVQPDPTPETPVRDGAPTFDKFLQEIRGYPFRKKSKEEQGHIRVERLKALEAPDAEVPLPDRLKSHEVIFALWTSDDPFARAVLLDVIATCPLAYGPWRALKRIFKEAEAKRDTEIYGALAARFDKEAAGSGARGVSGATLAYLARRGWRFLRQVGVQLPVTYADAAVDFLCRYPDDTNWRGTWIANHIFYHDSKKYGRTGWRFGYRDKVSPGDLKHRAYGDLWKRSPRPLFTLLERARADAVREFATSALKTDFRGVLRDVEPVWVVRLIGVQSRAIDEFVVWLLQNVPKFEQASFRTAGLHDAVLRLLDSPADSARKYAADYARTHARDLPVCELVRLANNSHEAVRKLAQDLIGERDPRTDIGLAAWGDLLESEHGFKFASEAIPKHFGAKELTPAWFADRLLSPNADAYAFARALLPKVHTPAALGTGFYTDLVKRLGDHVGDPRVGRVMTFAGIELGKTDVNTLDRDWLRWLLLFPAGQEHIIRWAQSGKLRPQALGVEFWKSLAFAPDWDADPWVAAFRTQNAWAADLAFDAQLSRFVLGWLGDPQMFLPTEVGFDWLMKLVARTEPEYHDFAVDTMIRGFAPSDFAPVDAAAAPAAPSGPVDLAKATFLFTGKLASMTREDAEGKVTGANGAVAGSVTKNLHYLVVGDEGSPLYGQGKKGSKQVKAEQLVEAGANIRIISETMFLQMLAGAKREASGDATLAGCRKLWDLAIAPGTPDAPVGKFARQYVRRHHLVIGQQLADKPVDPGTEIPPAFLTFDLVSPLFADNRRPVREFGLELAKWEFARWNPDPDRLVEMSELPFADARRFVAKALLADDTLENRAFRLDPAKLGAAAVYRFCESADEETRLLGMELLNRLPALRVPEELFRLTESPDRKVRAFVIRALWTVYRDRGVTPDWKPPAPPKPTIAGKAQKVAEKLAESRGDGVPARPETWPAPQPTLSEFLRRVLFELPPGPPEKSKADPDAEPETPTPPKPGAKPKPTQPQKAVVAKPLPARRAKLDAVETMRDLALEEKAFAAGILPLLDEFLGSRGASERAACLVAVTRIRHSYPEFKVGHSLRE